MKKLIGLLFLAIFLFSCNRNINSDKPDVSNFIYTYKEPKRYAPTFDRQLRRQKPPRQKILVGGYVKEGLDKKYSVTELESLGPAKIVFYLDPFDQNKKHQYTGIYLKDFAKYFAGTDYTVLEIRAIDGFKVDMPRHYIDQYEFFITWKNDEGYLTVDTMGPVRIIEDVGATAYKVQYKLQTSPFLVWQVTELIFKK